LKSLKNQKAPITMSHPEQSSNTGEYSKNSCTLPMLLVFMSTMGILVLLYFLSNLLSSVVILVCLAMVFAYILIIPVEWLEKLYEKGLQKNRTMAKMDKVLVKGFHLNARSLSVITVFLTFFLSTSLALILLAPRLTHQVSEFTQDLPGYVSRAEMHLIEWGQDALGPDAMKTLFPKETQGIETATTQTLSNQTLSSSQKSGVNAAIHTSVFSTTVTQMVKILDHLVESTLENLIGVVTHTLTGLIYFISGLILLFYFLLDGNTIRNGLLSIIPEKALPSATYFLDQTHRVMFNFVKGQVVLAIVSGAFMFLLYSIFQVKYAFFLSTFFTIAEILPVIGPWIAFTPGILVVLFSDHPEHAFYIWFIYVLIKDNFILPKVVGEVMGLHPVVVILSIFICAKIGGMMGVVLALPIASILTVMVHYGLHDAHVFLPSPKPNE
jgi:predicted PurR-regulated permease PerM